MKRILILGRRNVGEKNDAVQLQQAIAGHSSADTHGGYYEDVVFVVEQGNSTAYLHADGAAVNLATFDTIVMINWSHHRPYTDIAHSIALISSHSGTRVWNEELRDARSSTKLSQLVRLSYEHIVIPRTVFSLTSSLMEEYASQVGTPFVAKDPLASRGRNNHLCKNWNEFESRVDKGAYYVLQEFIPNDQSDLRMFVAGGRPELVILRRGSGDTHLNNISQGAISELVPLKELPAQLIDDTVAIARHFKRQLCGIDFMKNTLSGEYVFLEINTTPQIVNGAYVEEKAKVMAKALER